MPWISIRIIVSEPQAEALSDALLTAGALSVTVEDADAGTPDEQPIFGEPGAVSANAWPNSSVVALLDADADAVTLLGNAAKTAGFETALSYTQEQIADTDWVRQTQSQFDPIRITDRFWIVPTWHAAPMPDAINIALDPGLAFGTGTHPTTRLCLEWLESHLSGGEQVLDYGCGSGILAIAAMKLGAGSAHGIDIDPQAIIAARANAIQNDVMIQFDNGNTSLNRVFNIVVANILCNPLKMLAPILLSHCAAKGQVILSGVLVEQVDEVIEVYAGYGFSLAVAANREGWVCLAGIKSEDL